MGPFRAIQAFQNDEVDWVGNPFGSWYESVFSGTEGRPVSFQSRTAGYAGVCLIQSIPC